MQINKKFTEELKGYLFMLVGCIAYGASTSLFLAPNTIVAGGMAGVAVLINHFNENIPVGMMTLALNLPILALGVKFQGWKFIIRCLITIATLGVITDAMAMLPPLTDDELLASLYGGICQGIGIGMFVKYEFSSGGTELAARLIARFIKGLKIPIGVGILDGLIVIIGSIATTNPSNMLHALVVIFGSTKVSEMILMGFEKSKLCIIISDKGEEIASALISKSPRGVTMLDGQGMYAHKARNVLLTCVKNPQLSQLKQIVKTIDEKAFIIINESVEVRGQGFQTLE